jgi:hypothetical protein
MNQGPDNSTTASASLRGAASSDRLPSPGRTLTDEERMIDESVAQSFPASDPPTSSQPGNIVWKRYAAAEARRRSQASARGWIGLAMVAAGAACATVLLMRRPRRSSR